MAWVNTWFNMVITLLPPAYKNGVKWQRVRIFMQCLAEMRPAFSVVSRAAIYLKDRGFSTRFAWKKTLGALNSGAGSIWGYLELPFLLDGMGSPGILNWFEDLKMETPCWALFACYHIKQGLPDSGTLFKKPFVGRRGPVKKLIT